MIASDARQCQGDDVYVVSVASSAGPAALNLARFAKRFVLVVRAATLEETMSQYLVERPMAPATTRDSSSPVKIFLPRRTPIGGGSRVHRSPSRRACQASSLPATSGWTP